MGEPPLNVGGPRDERVAVPEADGLAHPTRHVRAETRHGARQVEVATHVDVADRVAGSAEKLHARRCHRHVQRARAAGAGPPAHEALGTTQHGRPLRRAIVRLVKELLDEPLLIFRREQRENRRDLIVVADDPLRRLAEFRRHDGVFSGAHQSEDDADVVRVASVPVRRHALAAELRRAAFGTGFRKQRLIVRSSRREPVGAHDVLTRVVRIAVTPSARAGIVLDVRGCAGIVAPLRIEPERAVAAEVARIAPKFPIDVEVVAREDVACERRDPFGRCAVLRRGCVDVIERHSGPDPLGFARHRPPAADTPLRGDGRRRANHGAESEN